MDTENSKISFCSFPFLPRGNPAHFCMSPDHEKLFGGVFVMLGCFHAVSLLKGPWSIIIHVNYEAFEIF